MVARIMSGEETSLRGVIEQKVVLVLQSDSTKHKDVGGWPALCDCVSFVIMCLRIALVHCLPV
eukprot:4919115-Prorocentrum_lima.AAC.1